MDATENLIYICASKNMNQEIIPNFFLCIKEISLDWS